MKQMSSSFEVYASRIPFPEGPVFDSQGNLFVCARRNGYIVKVTPDGKVHHFVDTGGKPNGLAIDQRDNLYVADTVRKEILVVDPMGAVDVFISKDWGQTLLVGPNDLCFGSSGALYFTDPGLSMDMPDGAVYCFHPSKSEQQSLASKLPFPNGLAVTPDEKTLYFVESVTDRLYATEINSDLAAVPHLICEFGNDTIPDGVKWFDEQHLVVAGHRAGALVMVDITAATQRVIRMPNSSKPTNLVIHQDRVYVTDDATQAVLVAPLSSLQV